MDPGLTEFADSYHLWTDDVRDVRALLRRAGRYAMILGDRGPFIPFVAEPEGGADPISAANRGVLVRYDFAEGYGVALQVFDGVEAGGSFDFGPRTAPRDAARFASTLARLRAQTPASPLQLPPLAGTQRPTARPATAALHQAH